MTADDLRRETYHHGKECDTCIWGTFSIHDPQKFTRSIPKRVGDPFNPGASSPTRAAPNGVSGDESRYPCLPEDHHISSPGSEIPNQKWVTRAEVTSALLPIRCKVSDNNPDDGIPADSEVYGEGSLNRAGGGVRCGVALFSPCSLMDSVVQNGWDQLRCFCFHFLLRATVGPDQNI